MFSMKNDFNTWFHREYESLNGYVSTSDPTMYRSMQHAHSWAEEAWNKQQIEIDSLRSTIKGYDWISVNDVLPDIDEWVLVYENDLDNEQDAFIGKMCGTFRQRVTPAKLLGLDTVDGFPIWYLCIIGSGPLFHVRNVTEWCKLPVR